ncbi:hypothetical protein [Brotaphodocola sp.]
MKMSRWMKWMMIAGVACCLIGVGIMTCGVMMGGFQHAGILLHKVI